LGFSVVILFTNWKILIEIFIGAFILGFLEGGMKIPA